MTLSRTTGSPARSKSLISRLDFFPKTQSELAERTLAGALISVLSVAFIVWAGYAELRNSLTIETVDRLVPQTVVEHGNRLSINLDVHFPALPCSDLLVEVTDTTGKEHLAFSDSSLSKLRTDAAGAPIGMPARMDFEARVALGLRLHRFMQVLGDALLQLVHFSLRSGCRRDYGATCPDHWKPLGGGRCEAPFWYFGRCNHVSVFAGYTPADKEDWSSGCEANWPCIGVPAELNASLVDGFNATAAQAAAARLRRHLAAPRHAAGPDAAAARRIALDGAEGEIAEVLAALDTATTPTSAAAAPPVRAAVEASLRSIKLAISGERAAEDADDEDSDLEHAEVAAEAAHHRDALAEAEARRSELALAELDAALAGFVGDDELGRLRGYRALQANLSAVVGEVHQISSDPAAGERLEAALGELHGKLEALAEGAGGLRRQQLEAQLEEGVSAMLGRLKLMRDGRQGEGCNLFGIAVVPRVSGALRVVPRSSVGDDGGFGFGDRLGDYSVRHALYFNVSHTVRHLSFGQFFPAMHNPLDNATRLSRRGAAEVRYMIQVVPSAYRALNGSVTLSNLFSATEHFHPLHWHSGDAQMPGVFFSYDISSMVVQFTEQRGASLPQATARFCALVGGVFTVAGIVDKMIFYSSAALKGRAGKLV